MENLKKLWRYIFGRNKKFKSYKELWQHIFGDDYRDKYDHESGLSGGGGHYAVYDIHLKQDVVLPPEYKFDRASSIEKFNVPNNWFLLPLNKSSIARIATDATFNTFVDNGFKGYLTLEIINHSNVTQKFQAGQPIMKLLALKAEFPCEPYDGHYQNQPDEPVKSILNDV